MRRIIQYGWDAPDTAYVRANSAAMEAGEPLDGVVIRFLDGVTNLGRTAFGAVTYNAGNFAAAAADLAATSWRKWDANLAQITMDTAVDLFASYSPTLANVGLVAKTAHDAGFRGIMFDPEEYGTAIWSYVNFDAGRKAAHTFGEYETQAKVRGGEFIQAVNAQFPGLALLCLYGPWFPAYNRTVGVPADALMALLFNFYEGVIESMDAGTVLIDGFESSYGYRTATEFRDARDSVRALPISMFSPAAAAIAQERLLGGFGLWLDNQNGVYPWDAVDLSNNYFTPQELAHSMRRAWGRSSGDGWVWVYNQTPRFRGVGSPMHADYLDSIWTARRTSDLSALVARTHPLP